MVIPEVIPNMKPGSILCEIASLKTRTAATLGSTENRCIQPLSIHPMFGPDIGKIEGQTIVVVPIRDREKETRLTRELFPKNEVVVVDAETHDSCMATVLSLPYFMNLVFAKTIPIANMALLRQLAGTTFTVQLAVTQSILGESPELIESLINENVFSRASISKFIDESNNIRKLLDKEPDRIKEFCDALHAEMIKDPEEVKSRRIRNTLFENLRT
jgi:prephenate dehydrogenase